MYKIIHVPAANRKHFAFTTIIIKEQRGFQEILGETATIGKIIISTGLIMPRINNEDYTIRIGISGIPGILEMSETMKLLIIKGERTDRIGIEIKAIQMNEMLL